jgi:hypothetical protein
MATHMCTNCCCPIDADRSGSSSEYCYVCDAMRTAAYESRYLRHIQETEEQDRCAARRRMGLAGPE